MKFDVDDKKKKKQNNRMKRNKPYLFKKCIEFTDEK